MKNNNPCQYMTRVYKILMKTYLTFGFFRHLVSLDQNRFLSNAIKVRIGTLPVICYEQRIINLEPHQPGPLTYSGN